MNKPNLGALGGNLCAFTKYYDKLNDIEREEYEERAAIIEFDGGLSLQEAEIEAMKSILDNREK